MAADISALRDQICNFDLQQFFGDPDSGALPPPLANTHTHQTHTKHLPNTHTPHTKHTTRPPPRLWIASGRICNWLPHGHDACFPPVFAHVSAEAKEALASLLVADPTRRLSAAEALSANGPAAAFLGGPAPAGDGPHDGGFGSRPHGAHPEGKQGRAKQVRAAKQHAARVAARGGEAVSSAHGPSGGGLGGLGRVLGRMFGL